MVDNNQGNGGQQGGNGNEQVDTRSTYQRHPMRTLLIALGIAGGIGLIGYGGCQIIRGDERQAKVQHRPSAESLEDKVHQAPADEQTRREDYNKFVRIVAPQIQDALRQYAGVGRNIGNIKPDDADEVISDTLQRLRRQNKSVDRVLEWYENGELGFAFETDTTRIRRDNRIYFNNGNVPLTVYRHPDLIFLADSIDSDVSQKTMVEDPRIYYTNNQITAIEISKGYWVPVSALSLMPGPAAKLMLEQSRKNAETGLDAINDFIAEAEKRIKDIDPNDRRVLLELLDIYRKTDYFTRGVLHTHGLFHYSDISFEENRDRFSEDGTLLIPRNTAMSDLIRVRNEVQGGLGRYNSFLSQN